MSKEDHITPGGVYEIWHDEKPKAAYDRIFGEALAAYNAKQKRDDRKIKSYYAQVRKDAKKHPVYEMIVGIYGQDEDGRTICPEATGKEIMRAFVDGWAKRNPNLELIGAYYHADEQGEPHVHIDYIPVAHGYKNGLSVQNGLVKALGEMGLYKQGKITAQIAWEARENATLDALCREHGLEVDHPRAEGRQHLDTETYKAEQALSGTIDQTRGLLTINDSLEENIKHLERTRDRAEQQAQKALERKAKALKRSFRKSDDLGFTYDATLAEDLEKTLKERAADVDKIAHTDHDIAEQYALAAACKREAEEAARKMREEAEELLSQAREDQRIAEDYRYNAEQYIINHGEDRAQEIASAREQRLMDFCKRLTFADGRTALEVFMEQEQQRRDSRRASRSHDRGMSR